MPINVSLTVEIIVLIVAAIMALVLQSNIISAAVAGLNYVK